MPKTILKIPSERSISAVVKKILKQFPPKKVFAFFGEMGAGKTTIIKEFCRQLGVKEEQMTSPTFTLINEYRAPLIPPLGGGGALIFHFYFYRIKNEAEVFDMGYEDYFYSGNYCFIEWAEKIPNLLPEGCVKIQIKVENEKRILTISA